MNSNGLLRMLSGYEKTGEKLIVELPLPYIPLEFLQQIFGESADNPMYDCYKLDKVKAMMLQKFVKPRIDTEQYDFFLENFDEE